MKDDLGTLLKTHKPLYMKLPTLTEWNLNGTSVQYYMENLNHNFFNDFYRANFIDIKNLCEYTQ